MTTKDTQDAYNPLAPYADVAGDVIALIGDRGQANGDPEVFGSVLGGLLEVYSRAVVPNRPMGGADAFVLQILESVAYIASGGVQAQRFRDITAAALAGSVHVERVMDAMRTRAAADAPEAPAAAPGEPDDGEGFKPNPDDLDKEGDQEEEEEEEGDVRAGARPLQVKEGDEIPRYGTPGQLVVGVARNGQTQRIGSFAASGDFVASKDAGHRAVQVERERAAAVRSTPEGMDPDDQEEGDPRAQGVEGRMGYA